MPRRIAVIHAGLMLCGLCSGPARAARGADSTAAATDRDSTGSVLVIAREPNGRNPIAFANAVVLGRRRGGMTDEVGALLIRDLAPGLVRVRLQQIGFAARVDSTVVRAGATDTLRFVLEIVPWQGCDLTVSDLWGGWDEADCNRNGIPDSTDIAKGYEDDLDRNGQVDFCEVYEMAGWPEGDALGLLRTFSTAWGTIIGCNVPADAAPARLVIRDASRREIFVVQDNVATGRGIFYWPLRDRKGEQVRANRVYYVSLETPRARVAKAIRWRYRLPVDPKPHEPVFD